MKFVRFIYHSDEKMGILEGDVINEISGTFFDNPVVLNNTYKKSDVKLLPPCSPGKIIAVGLNYVDHIKEFDGRDIPKSPVIFVKLPHTIIGPEDSILIPKGSARVDYEAELAVVIKKPCRKVAKEEAKDYILGATCLNDVTERDVQKLDGQWIRAKNFETFCPIGPYIVNEIDYNSLDIKLLLNGEQKQCSNTSNLLWKVEELISFISQSIPLNPGDIVTTGTPCGVGPMKDGDAVEVVIQNVGTLRNFVKNEAED